MKRLFLVPAASLIGAVCALVAEVINLPEYPVPGYRTAVDAPAATYAQAVSALRYLPQVDVQARNLAEGQADVALRGGTFENTGLRLGAASFWDPQTGHYLTEWPIPGTFLSAPTVSTGSALALGGLNATSGEVLFAWAPTRTGGFVSAGGGTDRLRFGSAQVGFALGEGWSAEAEVAASAGDGTRDGGDHRFRRAAARVARVVDDQATTLFVGRQEKFFAWPYLYAPAQLHALVGSSGIETEDLATDLVLLTHAQSVGDARLEVAAYHRRHADDYEFDRAQPGLFNPYEHETRVTGAGADLLWPVEDLIVRLSARVLADELDSTALVFGPYQSRTLWKLGAELAYHRDAVADARWEFAAGATLDGSNRTDSAASPLARVAWVQGRADGSEQRVQIEFARATQQPGYTALGSNPNGGLFRGAANLDRTSGEQVEARWELGQAGRWRFGTAVFHRRDRDLVDWIFPVGAPPQAARFARAIDVDVTGWETEAVWRASDGAWTVGLAYAWLHKDVKAGLAANEGSFYGLNFPEHRATVSLAWRPAPTWEVRTDQEFRVQESNTLRTGARDAVLGSASVIWRPEIDSPWELTATVDNLYGTAFEEVPGVPGTGRQASVAATWRW